MIFNSPQGIFGNTNAIPQCTRGPFALDECAPDSQAGLITIHAKYKGNPNYLLGTAPIYDMVPQRGRNGCASPSSRRSSISRSRFR